MTTNKNNSKNVKQKVVKKSNIHKEKGYIAFLLLAVVMFIVILISTVFGDVVQIINNEKETQALKERHTELLEEEASLNSEVVKLQDPEYKARYAREKFLYTKDGEKILTIIDTVDAVEKDVGAKTSEPTNSSVGAAIQE